MIRTVVLECGWLWLAVVPGTDMRLWGEATQQEQRRTPGQEVGIEYVHSVVERWGVQERLCLTLDFLNGDTEMNSRVCLSNMPTCVTLKVLHEHSDCHKCLFSRGRELKAHSRHNADKWEEMREQEAKDTNLVIRLVTHSICLCTD